MLNEIKKFREKYCDKCEAKECKRKFTKMSKCASIVLAVKEEV